MSGSLQKVYSRNCGGATIAAVDCLGERSASAAGGSGKYRLEKSWRFFVNGYVYAAFFLEPQDHPRLADYAARQGCGDRYGAHAGTGCVRNRLGCSASPARQ